MIRFPRWVAKLYADFAGYFWLPCPRCGQMFGGHEYRGSVECERNPGRGHAICCGDSVGDWVRDPAACEREHRRRVVVSFKEHSRKLESGD